MTRAAERLFALVRATLRNRMDDASLFEGTDAAQWREIYDLQRGSGYPVGKAASTSPRKRRPNCIGL